MPVAILIGALLAGAAILFDLKAIVLLLALVSAGFIALVPNGMILALVLVLPISFGYGGGVSKLTAMLAPIVALLLLNWSMRRASWPFPVVWPHGHAAVIFFAAVLFSIFLLEDAAWGTRLVYTVYFPMALVFFSIMALVRNRKDLEFLFWALVASGVFHAVIAIVEIKLGIVISDVYQQDLADETALLPLSTEGPVDDSIRRASGLSFHPIFLGGFLMLGIVIATAKAINHNVSARWRILALAAIPIMFYAQWLTYSRSSLLALGVCIGMAILLASRLGRVLSVVALAVIFVVLVTYGFNIIALVSDLENTELLKSIQEKGGLESAINSLRYRLESIELAWNVFVDKPFTGLGPLQSGAAWGNPDYLPKGASTWSSFLQDSSAGAAATHNAFFAILAEHGIFGIGAFVALWWLAVRGIMAAITVPEYRCHAKLLAVLLAGQFAFLMISPLPRETWLVLALSILVGRLAATSHRQRNYNSAIQAN